MARLPNFPVKIEAWTSQEQCDALQMFCNDNLTDMATALRQSVALFLKANHIPVAGPRPAQSVNGQHHQEQVANGL